MTERQFRLVIGALILTALYFDLHNIMITLITVLVFEGLTNWRIPILASRLRYGCASLSSREKALWPVHAVFNIGFDAERAWRFAVAILLMVTYIMYYEVVWFVPWFMGFAIFGAGLSGVCPMLLSLKMLGFR